MRSGAAPLAALVALVASLCTSGCAHDELVAPARVRLAEAQRSYVAERRRVDELEGARARVDAALFGLEIEPSLEPASTGAHTRTAVRPRPVVVVLDVEDEAARLEPDARDALSRYLLLTIVESGRFVAVPRGTMRRALQDEKAESLRACVDDACHLELGKALASQLVLSPRVVRSSVGCALAATLYELKLETTVWASVVPAGCSLTSLVDAARALAKKLPSAEGGGS
ncbi:hypothetical protein L6R52_05855 [Myxococcota bacterium]|nr:hypothetical protein [Myxococcota bacterium]